MSLGMLLNMVESICSMRLYDIFKLLIVVESSDKAEVGTLLKSLWDRSTDSSIVDYKMRFQKIRNVKDVNNLLLNAMPISTGIETFSYLKYIAWERSQFVMGQINDSQTT